MNSNDLTTLDLFLLGLIDQGFTSAYEFRERASISVGASIPSLRRLERFGYVKKGKQLSRNRRQLKLTQSGRKQLRTVPASLMRIFESLSPSDVESVLRLYSLAVNIGDIGSAQQVLIAAAKEQRRAEFEHPHFDQKDLATIYTTALRRVEKSRWNAERKVLLTLSTEVVSRAARNRR